MGAKIVGRVESDQGVADLFRWNSWQDFFKVSTSGLRVMQQKSPSMAHISLQKWMCDINWQPDVDYLWKDIWRPIRSPVESCFLWKIVYFIPTINHWQYPEVPTNDPLIFCVACNTHEDIRHAQWACNKARSV